MDPQDKTYSVVVFPYLKTHDPVLLGSFLFRSTDDLEGLSEDQAGSVAEIADMLYAMDNQRIERATYAISDRIEFESMNTQSELEEIGDIEAAVAYLYANPRHEFNDLFLTPENTCIVVLTPNKVANVQLRLPFNVVDLGESEGEKTDSIRYVDGYDGVFGLRHHFWVAPGSRVYGTTPRPVLNISQDLALDIQRSRAREDYRLLFGLLLDSNQGTDFRNRVFSAVRWFNRANSEHRDEAESFICLSVALETLIRVPHDIKKKRFVDAINLLLGRVPRLDDWAEQFYKARSEAVHEGHVGQVAFTPSSTSNKQTKGTKYQSLLAYGREVFQLCIGTVLTGASLASRADLESKLIANSERYESVCKVLNDDSIPPATRLKRLDSLARDIDRYKYVPDNGLDMGTMLGACRSAAKTVIDSCLEIDEELTKSIKAMTEARRTTNYLEWLEALRDLVDVFEKQEHTKKNESNGMAMLAKTTWHYLFFSNYRIKREGDIE